MLNRFWHKWGLELTLLTALCIGFNGLESCHGYKKSNLILYCLSGHWTGLPWEYLGNQHDLNKDHICDLTKTWRTSWNSRHFNIHLLCATEISLMAFLCAHSACSRKASFLMLAFRSTPMFHKSLVCDV